MREKDKGDVTAHEYLITPPGRKKNGRNTKKDTGVDSNLHWARLHTHKKKKHAKRNVSVAGTIYHSLDSATLLNKCRFTMPFNIICAVRLQSSPEWSDRYPSRFNRSLLVSFLLLLLLTVREFQDFLF